MEVNVKLSLREVRWAGVGWCGLVWAGVGWCGLVWAAFIRLRTRNTFGALLNTLMKFSVA
jgi:hypothetical protein